MKYINLSPWVSIATLTVVLTYFLIIIRKSRKEQPSDYIRRDLIKIWWMLIILFTLWFVEHVDIYLYLH